MCQNFVSRCFRTHSAETESGPKIDTYKDNLASSSLGTNRMMPARKVAKEALHGLVTDNLAEANLDEETVAGWPVTALDKNLNRFYEASQKPREITQGCYNTEIRLKQCEREHKSETEPWLYHWDAKPSSRSWDECVDVKEVVWWKHGRCDKGYLRQCKLNQAIGAGILLGCWTLLDGRLCCEGPGWQ